MGRRRPRSRRSCTATSPETKRPADARRVAGPGPCQETDALALTRDDRGEGFLLLEEVRFLQAVVTVSHRVFPLLVLFELNGVGEFLVANFAFHGFALRMRVVRRPNLAAEAPQHENARDIASTGPQIVLSEGEFESATRRHHENAYRPDRRPDPCGAKEHRAFVRRDEGARRPESAARGPPRR